MSEELEILVEESDLDELEENEVDDAEFMTIPKSRDKQLVRLDKWLWAARFFKTRALAAEAIRGGKVHVNGHRVKPGKPVQLGETLGITLGGTQRTVVVRSLTGRRGPATAANALYEETLESRESREKQREERLYTATNIHPYRRPNRRDRLAITRVKRTGDE